MRFDVFFIVSFSKKAFHLRKHYEKIIETSQNAVNALFLHENKELKRRFARIHNLSGDLDCLISAINPRAETKIFQLAAREFNFALFAAATGKYRHANASLRLFLELGIGAIYLSAYEIQLRGWLQNLSDCELKWAIISDHENEGVFSPKFVGAFSEPLQTDAKQFSTLAKKAYKECSQHVHGNMNTEEASATFHFNKDLISEWVERADAAWLSFLFAYCIRYLSELPIKELNHIEPIISECLGSISSVRTALAR